MFSPIIIFYILFLIDNIIYKSICRHQNFKPMVVQYTGLMIQKETRDQYTELSLVGFLMYMIFRINLTQFYIYFSR